MSTRTSPRVNAKRIGNDRILCIGFQCNDGFRIRLYANMVDCSRAIASNHKIATCYYRFYRWMVSVRCIYVVRTRSIQFFSSHSGIFGCSSCTRAPRWGYGRCCRLLWCNIYLGEGQGQTHERIASLTHFTLPTNDFDGIELNTFKLTSVPVPCNGASNIVFSRRKSIEH